MKQYIGTKLIEAEPAYRVRNPGGDYQITTDAREAFTNFAEVEDGYRVRYPDGYESWSPLEAFQEAYRPTEHMNFGLAIEAARKGKRMASRWGGWPPKLICWRMTGPS